MSRGHRAKRSLGQNFLVDPNLQKKIVDALGAGSADRVLEIGPGRGALTQHLVGTVGHLVLVELDDALAGDLQERYGPRPDVTVLHADILDVRLDEHVPEPSAVKVVGNIPYNITTPILFRLLERPRPRDVVLMVQQEVADRLAAACGTKGYGALSVGVQSVADVERLFRVGRRAFRPAPEVDSAVVRIRPHAPPLLDSAEEARLRDLVRAAFQWRRKQMGTILRKHPDLSVGDAVARATAHEVGFSLTDRPETLTPQSFVHLSAALARAGPRS